MDTEEISSDIKPLVFYILCDECGKGCSTKQALASHKKWKHEQINKDLSCSSCQKPFSKKSNLMRHMKTCWGPRGSASSHNTNALKVKCSLCNLFASSRVTLHNHYQKDHKIDLSEQQLTFANVDDFNIWKNQFELDTKSNYVKTSGTKLVKNGTQIDRYVCHRDGNFQPRGKNIRKIKDRESNKIGSYCPARIYVYISNENVNIKYIGTHLGHENEIDCLYIPKLEKKRLAQKIAQKIPFNEILNEIRHSMPDEPHRLHLLSRKDLWNIAASYNLNPTASLHDYSSVDARVSSSNLVRSNKAQGEHFEISNEVTIKCEDDSFEKRKMYVLDSFLKTFNNIKTLEQLQAVNREITILDDILKYI